MGRGRSKIGGGGGTKPQTIVAEFEKRINAANSLDELDDIIEELANNDVISNEQYTTLYDKALRKAQRWQP